MSDGAAFVMVMSVATPAMANHDHGQGESNDSDNRQNCKDGPPSNGEEGWNCAAGEPRKKGQP